MTPFVAPAEQMHNPGIALNILKDIGWDNVRIHHEPLSNTENAAGPYTITATIQADNGYQPSTVTLNYSINGSIFTPLVMAATANPNEFTAVIPTTNLPGTYSYFISLLDNTSRQFSNPGKIVRSLQPQLQGTYVFETGPDSDPPVITHSPKEFLLDFETELEISANVKDNIGIGSVVLEYRINGGSVNTQPFVLTAPEEDSIYLSTIDFAGTLAHGNTV